MSVNKTHKVSIVMGSQSDFKSMKLCQNVLKILKINFETKIVSAHRTPNRMFKYAKMAEKNKISVIIAGAGGSARPGRARSLQPARTACNLHTACNPAYSACNPVCSACNPQQAACGAVRPTVHATGGPLCPGFARREQSDHRRVPAHQPRPGPSPLAPRPAWRVPEPSAADAHHRRRARCADAWSRAG